MIKAGSSVQERSPHGFETRSKYLHFLCPSIGLQKDIRGRQVLTMFPKLLQSAFQGKPDASIEFEIHAKSFDDL